jgi:hypothetical protein
MLNSLLKDIIGELLCSPLMGHDSGLAASGTEINREDPWLFYYTWLGIKKKIAHCRKNPNYCLEDRQGKQHIKTGLITKITFGQSLLLCLSTYDPSLLL